MLIDALIALLVLGTAVGLVAGQTYHSHDSAGFSLHGWAVVAWAGLSLAYWTACERLWGATIGKRLFSIRVVDGDGGRPTWRQALIRNLMRLVDGFPYLLPYLLGFIVAKSNDQRRRIGDRLAGTSVTVAD